MSEELKLDFMCELLPAEFMWGDPLQPHILKDILSRYDQRRSCTTPGAAAGMPEGYAPIEQLAELLRGLECGPDIAYLPPAVMYKLGQSIAQQAKLAAPAAQAPQEVDERTWQQHVIDQVMQGLTSKQVNVEELRAALYRCADVPAKALSDDVEPMAWESITPVYTKFVSDRKYQGFSQAVKEWYKPIEVLTDERPTIATVSEMMKQMNPDQRLDIISDWCHGCGGPHPCHCMNDE